ncbi:hypothetical protein KEM54_000254, partial [Ascosphaera aggregata]
MASKGKILQGIPTQELHRRELDSISLMSYDRSQFGANITVLPVKLPSNSRKISSNSFNRVRRVAQELERIQKREAQTLADLEKRLGNISSPAAAEKIPSQTVSLPELTLESPRIPFAGPGNFRELEALASKA